MSSEPDYRLWLGAVLGALLILRLAALRFAATDLFFDEAQYWSWSRDLAFGYFSKPPLIAWIIRLATDVCGNAEWCVRSPSPILHTLTSVFIFLTARTLYDERIGFWSAVVFATLPAASFSSLLISTDVPLLVCWTLALYGWIKLVETRRFGYAVLIGVSIGFGLLAKYAAAYFFICIAIDAWRDRNAREALRGGRGAAVLFIALAMLAPNLWWNAHHSFATFEHTAGNAGWKGMPVHVGATFEFLGAQFAVFGPILFSVLLYAAWRSWREGCTQPECRLLSFSIPVLILLMLQALLSRALANWAAAAYPAATILVTALMLRELPRLFRVSLWLHVGAALVLAVTPIFAGRVSALTGDEWNPYARVLGWRELAAETRARADAQGAKSILTDNRETTAELIYYLRDAGLPVVVWYRGGPPQNHFEMTRPLTKGTPEPLLYVTQNLGASPVPKRFEIATSLPEQEANGVRNARFYLLSGYERKHDD